MTEETEIPVSPVPTRQGRGGQLSVNRSYETAGEAAMIRRAFGRLVRSPGVIPLEAARGFPERVIWLARRHLPLLVALQRRWGASSDASTKIPVGGWPDASGLPLVTARARRVEAAEAGLSHLDTAVAIAQRNSSSPPAATPARSPEQGAAAPPASLTPPMASSRSDGQSGATEQPLPVVRAQPRPAAQSPMTAALQRQASVLGGGAAEGPPRQGERGGDEPGPAAPPDKPPEISEPPLPVVRAQPRLAAQSPMTAALQRQASVLGGGAAEGSPGQGERGGDEPNLAAPPDNPPVTSEQSLPVVRAQPLPVRRSAEAFSLQHRTVVTEAPAGVRAQHASSEPGDSSTVSPLGRLISADHGKTASIGEAGQASAAGRASASGVTQVWGEPIVQRLRGSRRATGTESAQPDGAESEAAMPVIAQTRAVDVSTEPILSVRRSDAGVGDSIVVMGGMPDGRPLPVVAPMARAVVASGAETVQAARMGSDLAARRDAARTSVLAGQQGSVAGRAAVDEAGPGRRPSRGWEADASNGRVAALPVVAVPAAGPRMTAYASRQPELVWSGGRPAMPSNTTSQSLPVQRQGDNAATSSTPAGAHASPNTAAPGQGQDATLGGPPEERRARLDDLEMDRVANAVMERLKQRLQMEREARGL